ncbi:hypothetical protein EBU94_02345 [bacterium]|nr:hypothetical protein [bacterium]
MTNLKEKIRAIYPTIINGITTFGKPKEYIRFVGLTEEYLVFHVWEAYGESHYRIYSQTSEDLEFHKVSSPRYEKFIKEGRLDHLRNVYERKNGIAVIDELKSFFAEL